MPADPGIAVSATSRGLEAEGSSHPIDFGLEESARSSARGGIGTDSCPSRRPNGRRFLQLVNEQLDAPRPTRTVSKTMLRVAAPFHRISRESVSIAYQWTDAWIAYDTAFQDVFGPFTMTPIDEAMAAAVAAHS